MKGSIEIKISKTEFKKDFFYLLLNKEDIEDKDKNSLFIGFITPNPIKIIRRLDLEENIKESICKNCKFARRNDLFYKSLNSKDKIIQEISYYFSKFLNLILNINNLKEEINLYNIEKNKIYENNINNTKYLIIDINNKIYLTKKEYINNNNNNNLVKALNITNIIYLINKENKVTKLEYLVKFINLLNIKDKTEINSYSLFNYDITNFFVSIRKNNQINIENKKFIIESLYFFKGEFLESNYPLEDIYKKNKELFFTYKKEYLFFNYRYSNLQEKMKGRYIENINNYKNNLLEDYKNKKDDFLKKLEEKVNKNIFCNIGKLFRSFDSDCTQGEYYLKNEKLEFYSKTRSYNHITNLFYKLIYINKNKIKFKRRIDEISIKDIGIFFCNPENKFSKNEEKNSFFLFKRLKIGNQYFFQKYFFGNVNTRGCICWNNSELEIDYNDCELSHLTQNISFDLTEIFNKYLNSIFNIDNDLFPILLEEAKEYKSLKEFLYNSKFYNNNLEIINGLELNESHFELYNDKLYTQIGRFKSLYEESKNENRVSKIYIDNNLIKVIILNDENKIEKRIVEKLDI